VASPSFCTIKELVGLDTATRSACFEPRLTASRPATLLVGGVGREVEVDVESSGSSNCTLAKSSISGR